MAINQTVIDRLVYFCKEKNLSLREFELSLGFSNGLISTTQKRQSSLGIDKIVKILEMYRELSVDWLLFGTGEMTKEDTKNVHESNTTYNTTHAQTQTIGECIEKVKGLESLVQALTKENEFLKSLLKK